MGLKDIEKTSFGYKISIKEDLKKYFNLDIKG